jgi:hypothetical protein
VFHQFFSFNCAEFLKNFSELRRFEKAIFAPPECLDDVILEQLSQILDVGLLSKGLVEVLDQWARFHLGDCFNFLWIFCVMDQENENVLELGIILFGELWITIQEEALGVFSQGF